MNYIRDFLDWLGLIPREKHSRTWYDLEGKELMSCSIEGYTKRETERLLLSLEAFQTRIHNKENK